MDLLEKTLLNITPSDKESEIKAKQRLDSLVKPLGSLGDLERIAIKLSGVTDLWENPMDKKCVIVMSSDNGVVEAGVTSSPQEVTASQTINILKGVAGVGVLSKYADADLRVVNIGIKKDITYPGLINKRIRKGTWNIKEGPAMTREEAIKSIEIGIEIVAKLAKEGYNLLGTGEMGIGNTSTSSAVVMSLLDCNADIAVGKGAGLTEEGLKKKKRIINEAIRKNRPDRNDPLDILAKVGGFDIGGMVGCYLGAAYYRIPILIDGFISAVAALLSYKLNPLVIDYIFPSHCSTEPGFDLVMEELNLNPFLHLGMRLGEGTGAAIGFKIIEAAREIMINMATFEEVAMEDDFLIDIR